MKISTTLCLAFVSLVNADVHLSKHGRSLMYSSDEPITGVQFRHDNCNISLHEVDHDVKNLQMSERVALLFDLSGKEIRAGTGRLLHISEDCSIDDIVLASKNGKQIEHTFTVGIRND